MAVSCRMKNAVGVLVANHRVNPTWLIGALFEFLHPHWGFLLGEGSHAAAAKRVKPNVRTVTNY